jgi:hypothetical protein
MSTVREIAEGLVELCRGTHFLEAIGRYYSPDIVSVEAVELPGLGKQQRGIEAIRAKTIWWEENNEVHDVRIAGPFLGGTGFPNQFAIHFVFEITPKSTGQRVTFSEMGLYTVEGGKVVREEFFYPAG